MSFQNSEWSKLEEKYNKKMEQMDESKGGGVSDGQESGEEEEQSKSVRKDASEFEVTPRPIFKKFVGIDILKMPEMPVIPEKKEDEKDAPKYLTHDQLNTILEERLGSLRMQRKPTFKQGKEVRSSVETQKSFSKQKTVTASKEPDNVTDEKVTPAPSVPTSKETTSRPVVQNYNDISKQKEPTP